MTSPRDSSALSSNPYQPPGEIAEGQVEGQARVTRSVGPFEARATVELAEAPGLPIEVVWSGLTGRESYRVAGEERLAVSGFRLSGTRRFALARAGVEPTPASDCQGASGEKLIEVRFRMFPFWSAVMDYDGQLVVPELFPRARFFFRLLTCLLLAELVVGGVLGVVQIAIRVLPFL